MISFNNLYNAQSGVLFVQEEEAAQRQEISRKKSKILTEEMAKVRYCLCMCGMNESIITYTYTSMYLDENIFVYLQTLISVCMRKYIQMFMQVCMREHMYVRTYTHAHLHMQIHRCVKFAKSVVVPCSSLCQCLYMCVFVWFFTCLCVIMLGVDFCKRISHIFAWHLLLLFFVTTIISLILLLPSFVSLQKNSSQDDVHTCAS